MTALSRKPRARVRIVYGGRPILLCAGNHVIGRAPSCTVVLDERSVSRRHACIRVAEYGASIEDLGSANGVFVNGQRIREPEPLEDGDAVIVGEEELLVHLELPPVGRSESGTHRSPASRQEPDVSGERIPPGPTDRVDAFTLLAIVAERALSSNDPLHAEHVVGPRLLAVLDEAQQSPAAVHDVVDRALALSLSLAQAMPSARWLEYAIDLLAVLSKPCTDRLVADICRAKLLVGSVDPARLDAYARAIRKLTSTTATVRTLTVIDELKA